MSEKALKIIYDKLDPWLMEDPQKTKDQIFSEILTDIKSGVAFPFERDGMVFYVMPETKRRARLHLFSDIKSNKIATHAAKQLTSFMFSNINSLEKLYGITPHEKFLRVVHKFGWKHEGTLTRSYFSKSGEMRDQYIFGIDRLNFEMY
jgi:hypothetical protein